jgi:serine/threonine-protein kinase
MRACHASSPEVAWRLKQEARALARLDHPNVVPIVDAGLTRTGQPYVVMPRLVGETLRDRLARTKRISPSRACELFAGLLDGLAIAHDAGIVHRDVKPANIFLVGGDAPLAKGRLARASMKTDQGRQVERAVLLDFGIAKLDDASLAPTTASHVLGTPRYVAPEQIIGGEVTPQTDVYSLGVVLFEALAGESPFDARCSISMMRAHLESPPKRLGAIAPISPALERIVCRALAKRPALRFASAASFARSLRRLGGSEVAR